MRVLQINTVCGHGSTGRITLDIAKELEARGDECFIAYGQGSTDYNKSFKIGSYFENKFHNLGSRILGTQGYFSNNGTKSLISYILNTKPDVIHLHNLHGNYLNLEMLFEFLATLQIPIIWTLHDCWAFTAKCAHFTDVQCYKWQSHCCNCPQINAYPPSIFFDRSYSLFANKKKWVSRLFNLKIHTVSNWLAQQASLSMLGDYPITSIYNWVDHSKFRYIDSELDKKYGFDNCKFSIVCVSAMWSKSMQRSIDLLKLASMLDIDMQLIVVGRLDNMKLPDNIFHIDYVHGIEDMAEIYSFADVYVHLSTEDTFGLVIAEAMSCGTPVVVYESTACPELVVCGCGFVVPARNVEECFTAIKKIKTESKSMFSESCRNHVLSSFDKSRNIDQILQFYM
ncbi:MAG: glycosyltransferase [Tannerellaceae bacterium]